MAPAVPPLLALARFRLGKREEALETVRAAREIKPAYSGPRRQLARVLFGEGLASEGLAILRQACEEFPDDAELLGHFGAEAFLAGEAGASLAAIERARAIDSEAPSHAMRHIAILAALGRRDEATAQRQSRDDSDDAVLEACGKFEARLGKEAHHAEALALAEWAIAAFPNVAEPHLWKAEALFKLDRADDASASLALAPQETDEALRLRRARLAGRIAQALDDPAAEVDAWKTVLQLAPGDQEALTRVILASHAVGRGDEAKPYLDDLNAARRKSLPRHLAEGLAALSGLPVQAPVMDNKIRWGWELADKSRWTFDRWWARVVWGRRASTLVAAWWLAAPERLAELDALIDDADPSVFAGIAHTGCIITGTHLGPIGGGVRYLETLDHPLKTFGGNEIYGRQAHVTVTKNPFETHRALHAELKNGTWVAFAQDGRRGQIDVTISDQTFGASNFVPRVMLSAQVPSLWFQPLWRDGRIAIEAERLPDPQAGERREDWYRRWVDAFYLRVERVLRGEPENLGLMQGIWGARDGPHV